MLTDDVTFYVIKSGPFYLNRWPVVTGHGRLFGAETFETATSAREAVRELMERGHARDQAVLAFARVVKISLSEQEIP